MMAHLHLDQDLFSPIRSDFSFTDSSNNSEGNSLNIESPFSNIPKSEHNLLQLKSNETRIQSVSEFDNIIQDIKLKESKTSNCDSKSSNKSSKVNSFNSTKSVNTKVQNLSKQCYNYKKDFKGSSKTLEDKRVVSQLKETVEDSAEPLESCKQSDIKIKKCRRPTSLLLSKNKDIESNTLKESKKIDNKILRKSASSKHIHNKETSKEYSVDTFENNCQEGKKASLNTKKCIKVTKSKNLSEEQADRKYQASQPNSESIKAEILNEQLNPSKSSSNLPPQSQYEVSVEKMVHDYISFECDKIRQNMYTQQMYLYRQLNKIKDEMKQKHSLTTQRLRKVTEKLMHIDMSE